MCVCVCLNHCLFDSGIPLKMAMGSPPGSLGSLGSAEARLPLLRARATKALLVLRPQKRHSCRDSSGSDSS